MPGHDHSQNPHEEGHISSRPIKDLEHDDLQPAGNAATQDMLPQEESEFGDSWWDYTAIGLAAHLGEELAETAVDIWDYAASQYWWNEYKGAGETRRQEMALEAWQQNELNGHIDALSDTEQVDGDEYRDELGEVLDYLQQFEMMRAAGMTWEEMVVAQGQFLADDARADAEATHGGPVTDADIVAAHQESTGDQEYLGEEDTTWWDSLTPQQQAEWETRGQTAIATWVAHAHGTHPELEVKAREVGVDLPGNSNSVAYVDGNGKCWIGRETIEAIELNPSYADSTIMHEIRGHPEFDTGFSLSMELYDEAAPAISGYTRPGAGSDERDDEWIRWEYFESEIGSLMREEAFWVDSQDLDGNGTIEEAEENPLGSPEALLNDLLANVAGQFAPELQGPFVSGLARRFEADPRITEAASAMFAAACQRHLGVAP